MASVTAFGGVRDLLWQLRADVEQTARESLQFPSNQELNFPENSEVNFMPEFATGCPLLSGSRQSWTVFSIL